MHSRRYTADTEFLKPSELTMDLSSAHKTSKTLQASKNSLTPQAALISPLAMGKLKGQCRLSNVS